MAKINGTLKEKWQLLPAEKRQKLLKYGLGSVFLVLIVLSYYGSGEAAKRAKPIVQVIKKKLNLGSDLLKDDIQATVKSDLQDQNTVLSEQGQRLGHIEEMLPALQAELSRLQAEKESATKMANVASTADSNADTRYPPPPNYTPPPGYQNLPDTVDSTPEITEEIIGGVGHSAGEPQKKITDKKKQKGFYLAPGFMTAQLLHGIEAYTSEGAMANPEPILIRVEAPAVLPNDIRAELTGCFVLANAHGSLARERVEAQVVNLTCLSPDGSAVIDQEILGYVVDADGKKGLAANIVTKSGQHIGRSFIAGIAGGFGEGISNGGVQNSITGAGQVQTFDSSKLSQSALGQGLKDATTDIKKLFLELARQTMPVAEVGAAKKCTVVLQKGIELLIRQRDVF